MSSFSRLIMTFLPAPYSATCFRLSAARPTSGAAPRAPCMCTRMLGEPTATATSTHFLPPAIALSRRASPGSYRLAPARGGDVHDVRMGLLHCAAELLEVSRLGGRKMRVERLDVVDAELLDHHGGKIGQLESRVAGTVHETAEGIRCHGQPVARRAGKVDLGRCGGSCPRRGSQRGTGFREMRGG